MNTREWLSANDYLTPEPWLETLLDKFAAAKVEEFAKGLAEALDELYGEANENGIPLDTRKRVVAALAAYHEAVGR